MRFNFRHGIIRQSSNYLVPTASGINIVIANNTPLEVAIAHKTKNYLHTEASDVVAAWGLRPEHVVGNPAWLYIDIDPVSAVRSFGYTRYNMVVDATAPSTPVEGQHWFNTTTNTMNSYVSGSWREVIRIFIAKYEDNNITTYGTVGLSQVGIQSSYAEFSTGSILHDDNGDALLHTDNTFLTTETNFHIAGSVAQSIRLESDVVYAQALDNIPAFSVVVYTQYGPKSGKISLATYEDTDTSVLGFTTYDLAIGDVGTVITSGNIINNVWDWEAANVPIGAKLYVGIGAEAGTLVSVDPYTLNNALTPKPHVARVIGRNQVQFSHNYSMSSVTFSAGGDGVTTPATTTELGLVTLYNDGVTSPSNPASPQVVTIETLANELNNLSFNATAAEITTAEIPAESGTPAYPGSNVQAMLKLLHDNKMDKTPIHNWIHVDDDYTITEYITHIIADTSIEPIDIVLPSNPTTDHKIVVAPLYPTYSTNSIFFRRNGHKIMGSATDFEIDTNGIAVELVYVDSTVGWLVTDFSTVGLINVIDDSGIGAIFELTDNGIGHTHSGALTVNQINTLVEGTTVTVIATSSLNEAHSHNVTFRFDSGRFVVDGIASNHLGQEHTVEFADVDVEMWTIVSDDYTVRRSVNILANSEDLPFSITLPASPVENMRVAIAPLYPTYSTNNVTVVANGNLIAGQSSDLVLNTNGSSILLVFVGGSDGWAVINRGDTTVINTFNLPQWWEIVDTSQSVLSNVNYLADTTLSAISLTLPSDPNERDIIKIAPMYPTYATNPVTIMRNGQPIQNQAQDVILDVNGLSVELCYIDATIGWAVISRGDTTIVYKSVGMLPPDAIGFLENDGLGNISWTANGPLPSDAIGFLENDGLGNISWTANGPLPSDATGVLTNDGLGNLSWVVDSPLPTNAIGFLENDGLGNLSWSAVSILPTDATGVLTNDGLGNLSWSAVTGFDPTLPQTITGDWVFDLTSGNDWYATNDLTLVNPSNFTGIATIGNERLFGTVTNNSFSNSGGTIYGVLHDTGECELNLRLDNLNGTMYDTWSLSSGGITSRTISVSTLNVNGQMILNQDPTLALGAATKQYVDTNDTETHFWPESIVGTVAVTNRGKTANIDASGSQIRTNKVLSPSGVEYGIYFKVDGSFATNGLIGFYNSDYTNFVGMRVTGTTATSTTATSYSNTTISGGFNMSGGVEACLTISVGAYSTVTINGYLSTTPNTPIFTRTFPSYMSYVAELNYFGIYDLGTSAAVTIIDTPTVSHSGVTQITTKSYTHYPENPTTSGVLTNDGWGTLSWDVLAFLTQGEADTLYVPKYQPYETLTSTSGIVYLNVINDATVYHLTLTENVTDFVITNAGSLPANTFRDISVVVTQGNPTTYTCVSPATPGKTAGGIWTIDPNVGAVETLVLRVYSDSTVELYPSGVWG